MLSGVLEDPGQVIVRLTGHVDLVRTEHIVGELPAGCLVAAAGFMVNPRYPLRGRFDKPPPQVREEARQFTHDRRYAQLEVRIKTGIDSRLGGETLCLSHCGYTSWRCCILPTSQPARPLLTRLTASPTIA